MKPPPAPTTTQPAATTATLARALAHNLRLDQTAARHHRQLLAARHLQLPRAALTRALHAREPAARLVVRRDQKGVGSARVRLLGAARAYEADAGRRLLQAELERQLDLVAFGQELADLFGNAFGLGGHRRELELH